MDRITRRRVPDQGEPGRLRVLLVTRVLLCCPAALARGSTSVLTGNVIDASTRAPVGDVVVTATSPSLQGERVVITVSGTINLSCHPKNLRFLDGARDRGSTFEGDVDVTYFIGDPNRGNPLLHQAVPRSEMTPPGPRRRWMEIVAGVPGVLLLAGAVT